MPDVTRLVLPCTAFLGDSKPIISGDLPAYHTALNTIGPALAFENGDDEYSAVSVWFSMPTQYSGGTLKARLYYCTAVADNSENVDIEIYVEAVTPNSDTLNLNTTLSFDSANQSLLPAAAYAYDAQTATITLSNNDGVEAGDIVRLQVRRDSDDGSDTAAGTFYLLAVELLETE